MTGEPQRNGDARLAMYRESVVGDDEVVALRKRIDPRLPEALAGPGSAMGRLAGRWIGVGGLVVTAVAAWALSGSAPDPGVSGVGSGGGPELGEETRRASSPPDAVDPQESVGAPQRGPDAVELGDAAELEGPADAVPATAAPGRGTDESSGVQAPIGGARSRRPGSRRRSLASEPAGRAPAQDGFAEELRIIKRARAELRSGSAAAARQTLQEHQLRFGHEGTFGAEGSLLRVMAWCRGGDPKAAAHEAQSFREHYPNHPLGQRLDRSCVGPNASPDSP